MPTLVDYLRDAQPEDLTIVSASYKTSRYLRLNRRLVDVLNPGKKIWWLVVENAWDNQSEPSLQGDDSFVVLPGAPVTAAESETIHYGSLQHAKAINIGVNYCATNRIVILDPDCFVILNNWIEKIHAEMTSKSLCFWGVPYHPERLCEFNIFGKTYMYFPTAICMAIDREKLNRQYGYPLDFMPRCDPRFGSKNYYFRIEGMARAARESLSGRFRPDKIFEKVVKILWREGPSAFFDWLRLFCGSWGFDRRVDIGSEIVRLYRSKAGFGYASLTYARRFPALFNLWKHCVPQILMGYPKRRGYWIRRDMPGEVGKLSAQGRWEQFWFGNEPFAVHIGKSTYLPGQDDHVSILKVLSEVLPKECAEKVLNTYSNLEPS